MIKRTELLFTPTQKIPEWLSIIDNAIVKYGDVYVMSDTETTSNELKSFKGELVLNNRMLEYAFVFYYYDKETRRITPLIDNNGDHIFFHELCNFIAETEEFKKKSLSVETIPSGSIDVHGITEGYLLAEEHSPKSRPKLNRMALPFSETIDVALRMFCTDAVFEHESPIKVVFHNAFFDTGFFNNELRLIGKPRLESYAFILDTLHESRRILPGLENYTLDNIYKIACEHFNEKPIKRPFHDARTDSEMLALVLNLLMEKK